MTTKHPGNIPTDPRQALELLAGPFMTVLGGPLTGKREALPERAAQVLHQGVGCDTIAAGAKPSRWREDQIDDWADNLPIATEENLK